MTKANQDQFTLLYEDSSTKVLYEFNALFADEVIQHLIDFLKGCGYMEESIFGNMQALSEAYFDSLSGSTCVMKKCKHEAE